MDKSYKQPKSIKCRTDKQIVVYAYNRILLCNNKKMNRYLLATTWMTLRSIRLNERRLKNQLLYDSIYMTSLKNQNYRTRNQIWLPDERVGRVVLPQRGRRRLSKLLEIFKRLWWQLYPPCIICISYKSGEFYCLQIIPQ